MDQAELEMEDFIEKYLANGIDVIPNSNTDTTTDTTNTTPVESESVAVPECTVNSIVIKKTVIENGKYNEGNTTTQIPTDNFEYKSRKFVSSYSPTSDNLRRRPLATHPWCAEEKAKSEIGEKRKDSDGRLSSKNKCMFALLIFVNIVAVYVICSHVECENVKNVLTGGLHQNMIVNWIKNRFTAIPQKDDASIKAKSEDIKSSPESVVKEKASPHKGESGSAKTDKVGTPIPEVQTPSSEVKTPTPEVQTPPSKVETPTPEVERASPSPEVKQSDTEKDATTKGSADTSKNEQPVPRPPSPAKSK